MSGELCLGIACSPSREGNTDILMKLAMETLRSHGADTETVLQLKANSYL